MQTITVQSYSFREYLAAFEPHVIEDLSPDYNYDADDANTTAASFAVAAAMQPCEQGRYPAMVWLAMCP